MLRASTKRVNRPIVRALAPEFTRPQRSFVGANPMCCAADSTGMLAAPHERPSPPLLTSIHRRSGPRGVYVQCDRSARRDRHGCTAGAADLNDDGYADLAVGAQGAFASSGAVFVFTGSSAGLSAMPVATLRSPESGPAGFGLALSAGDVNADGNADLLVGAIASGDPTGRAYLFLQAVTNAMPAQSFAGPPGTSGRFGAAVATIGDFDHDGFGDVAIGSAGAASDTGRVDIFGGTAIGLREPAVQLAAPEVAASRVGIALNRAP